jgi:hypothetical protein
MSSQIDFRTLPANVPSLCIPRVYSNINESRIRKIFEELTLGIIDRIDIIGKTTDKKEKFNRVFIHFKRWFTDGNAEIARERLLNGKDIKIIYDEPWFWKVSAYRPPQEEQQRASHDSRPQKKKPTLQFEDSDDEKDEFGRDRCQRPMAQRERPVERPMQRPVKRPAKKPLAPRSPSSSPPPREKHENQIFNQQEPIPVVHRRLTMKPSQVKTPQVKTPQVKTPQVKTPLILEEGEIVEN